MTAATPAKTPVIQGGWTRDNFRRALRLAVQEKGTEYRYPGVLRTDGGKTCQYTVAGTSACIVGVVIELIDGAPYLGPNERAGGVLQEHYGVTDPVILAAAVTAQKVQDTDYPWGLAEERALQVLARGGGE